MSGGFEVGTGSAKRIKFIWNAPKELELITWMFSDMNFSSVLRKML